MGSQSNDNNTQKCLNCDTDLSGEYCSECGQKSSTERFTLNYVVNNILAGFIYFEKGLPYTVKQLTLMPSKTVIGFLEGKRAKLVLPFQYLILGVSLLMLSDLLFPHTEKSTVDTSDMESNLGFIFGQSYGNFIKENLKYLWISMPIFHGMISNLFYTRKNISEHIIINSYVIGHSALLAAIVMPFIDSPLIFSPIPYLLILFVHIITFKSLLKKRLIWIVPFLSVLVGSLMFALIPTIIYGVYYFIFIN